MFAVNGEGFEVSNVDPSTTLLEFLRYHSRFKSVKLGCGEGKFSFLYWVYRFSLSIHCNSVIKCISFLLYYPL